jgi:hypothetical protein
LPQALDVVVATNSKKGRTGFNVVFNEPVNSSAANPGLYHVFGAVTKVAKRHKQTVFTKPVGIKGVSVNGATATLTLAKPFKGTVDVMVQGTVTAANGASNGVSLSKIV